MEDLQFAIPSHHCTPPPYRTRLRKRRASATAAHELQDLIAKRLIGCIEGEHLGKVIVLLWSAEAGLTFEPNVGKSLNERTRPVLKYGEASDATDLVCGGDDCRGVRAHNHRRDGS